MLGTLIWSRIINGTREVPAWSAFIGFCLNGTTFRSGGNLKCCSVADDACLACSAPPAQFALPVCSNIRPTPLPMYSVHCLLTYTIIGILASKLRFMSRNAKCASSRRFLTCAPANKRSHCKIWTGCRERRPLFRRRDDLNIHATDRGPISCALSGPKAKGLRAEIHCWGVCK